MELLEDMGSDSGHEILEEITVVSGRVWWRRNAYVFLAEFRHPNAVVQQPKEVIQEIEAQKTNTVD